MKTEKAIIIKNRDDAVFWLKHREHQALIKLHYDKFDARQVVAIAFSRVLDYLIHADELTAEKFSDYQAKELTEWRENIRELLINPPEEVVDTVRIDPGFALPVFYAVSILFDQILDLLALARMEDTSKPADYDVDPTALFNGLRYLVTLNLMNDGDGEAEDEETEDEETDYF